MKTVRLAALAFLAALGGTGAGAQDAPAVADASAIRKEIREGRYPTAEAAARLLLQQVESGAAEELAVARAEDVLVEALIANGKPTEARAHGERVLAVKEKLLPPDDPDLAMSLENMGRILWYYDEWPAAGLLQERALEIRRKVFGPEHPLVAQSLFRCGQVKERAANWPEARALHEQALAMRERTLGPDHPLVADVLNSLGNLQVVAGDLDAAARLHNRALAIRERGLGRDHPEVAMTLHNLGNVAFWRGDHREAERVLERMIDIEERVLPPDHWRTALGLINLGTVLGYRRDFARAIPMLERALDIDQRVFGPNHSAAARDLDTLAEILMLAGDYERALQYAKRALSIQESIYAADSVVLCDHLYRLASILEHEGKPAEARRLYERSLAIQETSNGPDHFFVARTLLPIGRILASGGDLRGGRQRLERAAGIFERSSGDESPMLAEVLAELAEIDLRERKLDSALQRSLRAETIAREHLRRTSQSLAESEALRYESKRISCLDLPLTLASRNPRFASGAWDAVVRSRALLLDEMALRHRRVLASSSKEIGLLASALATARGRYTQILTRGPSGDVSSDSYRADLSRARGEMERAERSLAARSEEFGTGTRVAGLTDVLADLPAGSALLSYVEYERVPEPVPGSPSVRKPTTRSYLALVARKDSGALPAVLLGSAQTIDTLVERFRHEAATAPTGADSMRRYVAAGEDLRRAIWDPVARSLGSAAKVFVVPDGQLLLVNLATLPVDRKRFLVETGPELVYLSAERDLLKPASGSRNGGGLLVLGGADFDADPDGATTRASLETPASGEEEAEVVYRGPASDCASFRSMKFVPIPASLEEVSEIASLWTTHGGREGDVRKLTGSQALEGSFKRLARDRQIIHIATHGFQVQDGCAPSGQSLSPRSPRSFADESPLLLSGLALAGANRRSESAGRDAEDGILTAEEVASLDLRGTDWVVLSSCESGVGPIQRSEGVFGLRRAFQSAGAEHLVMSLWPVPDQVARGFVGTLYEEHLSGRSTSDAMRRAALRSLEQRRRLRISTHPFFWGAFVATGADD